MNVYTFTGRIGNDAEVRYTPSQKAVCGFSVAVESGFGDKKKTTWVKCTLWGKRAEGGLPQYLTKGTQVAVSGEASLDEWESNGKSGSNLAVNVNDITLIGGKQEQQQQAPRSQSAPAQQQGYASAPQNQAGGFDDFDDDVPF